MLFFASLIEITVTLVLSVWIKHLENPLFAFLNGNILESSRVRLDPPVSGT